MRALNSGFMCPSTTGDTGNRCSLNLPVSPIHDLIVKDDDLRGRDPRPLVLVLDDLTAPAPARPRGTGARGAPVSVRSPPTTCISPSR